MNIEEEFKNGYQEGKQDTREVLETGEMTPEYSFRIGKLVVYLATLLGIIFFFIYWLLFKTSLLLSLVLAFFSFYILTLTLGVLIGGLFYISRHLKNK